MAKKCISQNEERDTDFLHFAHSELHLTHLSLDIQTVQIKYDLVFEGLCFTPSCLKGLVVNGQLIGSKKMHKNKLNTYFGTISIYYQPDGVSVTVSTESIIMTDGMNNHSFTWGSTAEITQDG